ncbi:helix-turn-helix domain-containing protein [Candidatus Woesearchaeota archaeon]|nr:helix-turn-helix domain-containing protein [Candidatus Woesearchaeota archaeon]
MPNLSQEKEQLIQDLYTQNLSLREIAQRADVSKSTVYNHTKLKERGFASHTEYKSYTVQKRGFASLTEYQNYLSKENKQKITHKLLSTLITTRLKELGKNQSWLAEELNLTRQMISYYIKGINLPRDYILTNLFSVLEVPYKTIDDLIK